MERAAEGSPKRRRCKCPNCLAILIEPVGIPVYECPICSKLLRAKRTPPGQSLQIPLNENGPDKEARQQTEELEAKAASGSEANRSQGQEQLDNHETNAQISMNGSDSHQKLLSVPVRDEAVSVLENEMEQEVEIHSDVGNGFTSAGNLDPTSYYASKKRTATGEEGMAMEMEQEEEFHSDVRYGSTSVGNVDTTSDDASTESTTIGEEGMAVEMEQPLDYVSKEGTSASKSGKSQKAHALMDHTIIQGMAMEMEQPLDYVSAEGTLASESGESQKARVLMDHTNTQGMLSNGDGKAVLQTPLEDAQNCSMASSSTENVIVGKECERMEGNNYKEYDALADGNDRMFETDMVKDNDCKKSTTISEEGMSMEMQQSLDFMNDEGASTGKSGGISSSEDNKAVLQSPSEDAQNCSMASSNKEEDVLVGGCEGMKGKNIKECDTLADGNDENFKSEIIRDNDCKKSTAIGEEGMAMEMQQPLEYVSEESSSARTSGESQEAEVLMDLINIPGISSSGDGKTFLQTPLEDVQNCSMASSSKEEDVLGKNCMECVTLADGNDQILESEMIRDNACKKSTAIGEEGMVMEMQQPLEYAREEGSSASKSGESQEAQVLMDDLNIQGISGSGDGKAVLQSPLLDAQNCSMANSSKEVVFVGDCEGLEGKNYMESDTLADGNDRDFESGIIRDNACKKNTVIGKEGMGMEMQQSLDYLSEEGSSASKSGESQEAQVLMDHVIIQGFTNNGDGKAVLQSSLDSAQNCSMARSSKEEDVFVGDCEGLEGKNYKECNTLADGNDRIFKSEKIRDNACKKSTAIGEEGMVMEMQHPLDYVSEDGSSASKNGESQEAQVLMDHINLQVISSNGDGKAVIQSPLKDAQNRSMASSSKEDLSVGECEGMEGKNHKECDTLADGSNRIFESEIIRNNACNINIANGEEGMAMKIQQALDYLSEEGTSAASKNSKSQEAHMVIYHINTQGTLSSGDDKAVLQSPLEDRQNCSMSIASEEENALVGECPGVEGKNHMECDTLANGSDRTFGSEIIRDELSFKYISSTVELNKPIARRKGTYRLTRLSSEASVHASELSGKPLYAKNVVHSSDEDSDESECYSSVSEVASHDGSDSDFDFPVPSAESMLPGKLTDTFLQQKRSSSSDVPATPHQLEWQVTYNDNEEYTFQNSNGAIVTSVGVVGNIASDVLTVQEQGDQVEIAEVEPHTQEEKLMKRESLLRGHNDTVTTVSESLHAQRETGCFGLGGLSNTVGSVASEGGAETVFLNVTAGTEEIANGYQGTPSYQPNERKPRLSNDSWDEVSGSVEGLSSGTGHPLKLKARCTLEEGNLKTSALSLGGEPFTSSLPAGGREKETCLAVQEDIQSIKSLANVSPKDSIATGSPSDYAANAGANHSKISSQMISTQKIRGRSSDGLHLQHGMLMPVANNQSRTVAPSSDLATKRNVADVSLARNKELESAGLRPSLVAEQGNLSSGSAFNISERRLHHNRNYLSEKTQMHTREGVSSMLNVEGELSSKHTSQSISRTARTLERSSKTHQRRVHADSVLADGQGPLLQRHYCQAETMTPSGPMNDVRGFSPMSSQPLGFNNHYNECDVFARGVPSANMAYSYQAPAHPLMLPVAMQGHACSHFGCHSVAPVYMACAHCQHSHLPQPIPPCGFCFNQSLSMAHQQGHPELRKNHQFHQVQAPDQGVPVVRRPSTCFSSQTAHVHDTAMPATTPLVSSARRPKHYPPLPRGNSVPYVICKGCEEIIQVPTDLPLIDGETQKLRCGACHKVSKFSVSKRIQEMCNVSLQSSALESRSETSANIFPLGKDTTKDSRQPPVLSTNQSMESSYHQGLASGPHPMYKQGAITNSQHQTASAVVPAGVNRKLRHSSDDEIIYKTQSEQGEADSEITAAITDHSSQEEFFFRSLSRHFEFDSSRYWFKSSSSALGAINRSDEGMIVGNDLSLQPSVDEKEEGLAFGAPRMSDGESLDPRSPESRKRSPESKQGFQLVEQNRYRKGSFEEGEASWVNEFQQRNSAQDKMPNTSLIALLNQESNKFEINLEERVSFEKSRSALWSPATNSPMCTAQGPNAKDEDIDRPHNYTAQHFLKKGPRYITGMLRRSLKDLRK